jgi:RNA polymerase sigma factor (sigma-70 family)
MSRRASTPRRRKKKARQRLAQMNPEDRRMYETIAENLDYVDHPSFHESDTEADLFGPDAEVIDVPEYSLFPDQDGALPARHHTITRQQERTLFLRYNYARFRACELLDKQDTYFSVRRARKAVEWYRKAMAIRKIIMHANLALVPSMIGKKKVSLVDFSEQMSEGYLAVLRSVERFDVSRGYKFSTYACRSILSAFQYLGKKAVKHKNRFGTEFDQNHEENDYLDRRHDKQRGEAIDTLREVIRGNHADLTETEMQIIHERFPLIEQRKPSTLKKVGQMVGLTNERVRQIERRSLGKIRQAYKEVRS